MLPGPASRARRARARVRARWWWQPDKWERLSTVARLAAGAGTTVADVGGRGHELHALMAGCTVTSVNVEPPCDVLVRPGATLPFADGEFGVVVSTDVLEHVPPAERAGHVAELLRIARQRVVLCFPVGTTTKSASERRVREQLERDHGVRLDFLDEHVELGLPRADDVVALAHREARRSGRDVRTEVLFSDGVVAAEDLLLDAYRAVEGHQVGAVIRTARRWLVRRWPVLTVEQSEDNNRAYVVIDLGP